MAEEPRSFPFTLVLTPFFPLLGLAACTESLRVANRESGRAAFSWTLATPEADSVVSSSGITLAATPLAEIERARAVILLSSYHPENANRPALKSWLRRQDRQGALLASVDTGGYLLARAGVLRGRRIAVHPESLPAYEAILGESVMLDRLFGEDRGLHSSAGGAATLDMMLGLISQLAGRGIAGRVAQVLTYRPLPEAGRLEEAKGARAPVRISRVDQRLGRLVELMQAHLNREVAVGQLCALAEVPPATARRLFLKRFQQTPGRYLLSLRLERARNLLRNSALPIGEIAQAVGFSDPSAFARSYRRTYGLLPSADRESDPGQAY